MEFNFKQGDIVEFCNEEFIVIENYGNSGKVRENHKDGVIITKFYWEYYGEKCVLKEGI